MGKYGACFSTIWGTAHITQKGYARVKPPAGSGRQRMLHDLVWESTNGPIPAGIQIHHLNEIKLDNRIENLEALDATAHKREHSDCRLVDGLWWKWCDKCRSEKPETDFYFYPAHNRLFYKCKACCSRDAVAAKQARKLLAVMPAALPSEAANV